MRHVIRRITLLVAALMVIALPVLASDATEEQAIGPALQSVKPTPPDAKDECLLVSANNCDRLVTFRGKIDEIKREINKGAAVYTDDELRILNKKLVDTINDMNEAYTGGS